VDGRTGGAVSHYLDDSDLSGAVVLVVHAHPDDEVFATGAATIAAQRAGASVHLRLFTGGEGRGSGPVEGAPPASSCLCHS
jgi:LmbE family N-acetylglucosaminyl deacetylase